MIGLSTQLTAQINASQTLAVWAGHISVCHQGAARSSAAVMSLGSVSQCAPFRGQGPGTLQALQAAHGLHTPTPLPALPCFSPQTPGGCPHSTHSRAPFSPQAPAGPHLLHNKPPDIPRAPMAIHCKADSLSHSVFIPHPEGPFLFHTRGGISVTSGS